MLVLYFNNIVAVVLEHYKKNSNKETIKQTSNAKKLWELSQSMVVRYCIFPKMYCWGRAWSVKSKRRMIFFYIILHPAVLIYDFHIFITSSSSFYRFITNLFNGLLPAGLLVQLVERCTCIAEVKGSNPVQARKFFFTSSFRNFKSCVYNWDNLLSYNSSLRSSHVWFSYIHNLILSNCC